MSSPTDSSAGAARPGPADPARDLRYQLWLGSGCFVLMLCGLLVALYSLSIDSGLHRAFDRTLAQSSRALQVQQALVDLRHRPEQALRDNLRIDTEMERTAQAVRDLAARLTLAQRPDVGEEAQRTLRAAVDDSLGLYRRLADATARAPVRPPPTPGARTTPPSRPAPTPRCATC
jgi:hypothetical protein